MKSWLKSLSDLTSEQEKVVKIPPQESSLIQGLPGSGKTQVLVQRAAYFIQSHSILPQNMRLFVLTDVMEELISSEIMNLGYPGEMVITFDHWCHSFYLNHISQDFPRVYINGRIDSRKTHFAVLDLLQRNEAPQKNLRFALVDDGQDLTPEAFKILSLVAQHITVFSDPLQKLHQEGSSESFILDTLNLKKRRSFLQEDYRSSPAVAHLASHFIDDENFRQLYRSQVRTVQSTSENALCYIAPSGEKELSQLSQTLQQRLIIKDKVGILVPTNSLVHQLAKALKDRGIETEKAISSDAQNVIHKPFDFSNNIPKITTYHMAKGLTFDSVLMPQLTENAFAKIPSSLRHRLLFVGIARASKWVYMSTVKGQEFQEIATLRSTQKNGYLTFIFY